MDVKFANSFFDSLKDLIRHETWWYKAWSVVRYKIPAFFRNVWRFRKELYEYRRFDWRYQISMFRRGLELEVDYIEKYGYEIDETRLKKVQKMRRAIEIIKLHENDDFIEAAEKELGYEYAFEGFNFIPAEEDGYFEMVSKASDEIVAKNKILSDRSREIEDETWKELIEILNGQDFSRFNKDVDWNKQFDGSGLKSWWD